jgi:hypothetical protein
VSLVYGNAVIPIAGSVWFPTPVIVTTSAVVAAASGGVAQVSLRLTGVSGDPHVDDVFIDPWNRR